MKKNIKTIIGLIIAFIIGISTTVTAATVFRSQDITYSSNKTTKTNVKDSLDELYTKANAPWSCASGYICYEPLADKVKIGDYISMTPTITSYTPSSILTGYTGTLNSFNPSELKLWVVIRKNIDGTVDAVSRYASTTGWTSFSGQTGYMNLVGALNEIAKAYTNEKYVSKTRHIGYSNQIEFCKNLSECISDEGYETDLNLVKAALGTYSTTNPSGGSGNYWLASRWYVDANNLRARHVPGGYVTSESLVSSGSTKDQSFTLRPVLTFKANVQIKSGSGTASSPYQLN